MQPFWPLHWISCLMKHVTKALLVVGLCLTSNKINLFDVLHWTPYTMVLQPPPVLYFPGKLIFLPVLYSLFGMEKICYIITDNVNLLLRTNNDVGCSLWIMTSHKEGVVKADPHSSFCEWAEHKCATVDINQLICSLVK